MNWSPFFLQKSSSTLNYRAEYPISWFNPKIDTIYIGASSRGVDDIYSLSTAALDALTCAPDLRYLAVEIREWYQARYEEDRQQSPDWELGFFARFGKLERFIIADYDYDWVCIGEGEERPSGEVQFVECTQMDMKSTREMAPGMLKRLEGLGKKNKEVKMPKVEVKEVNRGGVLMTFQ